MFGSNPLICRIHEAIIIYALRNNLYFWFYNNFSFQTSGLFIRNIKFIHNMFYYLHYLFLFLMRIIFVCMHATTINNISPLIHKFFYLLCLATFFQKKKVLSLHSCTILSLSLYFAIYSVPKKNSELFLEVDSVEKYIKKIILSIVNYIANLFTILLLHFYQKLLNPIG